MKTDAFGKKVRELREAQGITQAQLANQLSVSRSTITNWEIGNRLPDISMMPQIAECLGVEPYMLIEFLYKQEENPVVIVVEDIHVILHGFKRMLSATLPRAAVYDFSSAAEALDFARSRYVSVAFLDIELGGDDGMKLARDLIQLNSRINIIFLTSHAEYALDAFAEHCSGYVMKPLTPEKILSEIRHLRFPVGGLI